MDEHENLISLDQATLPLYVGIDVGGTTIKIGVVDDEGRTLAYGVVPTNSEQGPDDAVKRTAAEVEGLLKGAGAKKEQVARIGLATPGPLDLKTGKLLTPGNLQGWWDYPVRQKISEACGLPVRFANDANAAAYGEFWRGAGADVHSMILLTLGTGIGGGIIIGDLLIEGENGCGGECGHILIDPYEDAPLDTLNKTGTLEAFCGSYGVVGRAERALEAGRQSQLNDVEKITPLAIAQAAEAEDHLALEVVMDTAKYLGWGIVTLIHTIDPDSVVLGGAMNFGGAGHSLGEAFLQKIRDEAKPRLFPSLRESLEINFAKLGGDAGYIGAAGLARLEHHAEK